MKTVYIPKGETVRYESLMTEHLVVHGCLQVSNGIKARTIAGQGTINAGSIDADVIRVDDVEAGSIVCKRLLAKRVQSPEVFASESAAVSCFLSAADVSRALIVALGGHDAAPVAPCRTQARAGKHQVHAAQQGGLARTGGADEAHDLAGGDLHVDALEHLDLAVGLVQVRNAHRGGGHG